MRCNPGDGLTHDLHLVVITLDGDEHLAQRLGLNDVQHELKGEPTTHVHHI